MTAALFEVKLATGFVCGIVHYGLGMFTCELFLFWLKQGQGQHFFLGQVVLRTSAGFVGRAS